MNFRYENPRQARLTALQISRETRTQVPHSRAFPDYRERARLFSSPAHFQGNPPQAGITGRRAAAAFLHSGRGIAARIYASAPPKALADAFTAQTRRARIIVSCNLQKERESRSKIYRGEILGHNHQIFEQNIVIFNDYGKSGRR